MLAWRPSGSKKKKKQNQQQNHPQQGAGAEGRGRSGITAADKTSSSNGAGLTAAVKPAQQAQDPTANHVKHDARQAAAAAKAGVATQDPTQFAIPSRKRMPPSPAKRDPDDQWQDAGMGAALQVTAAAQLPPPVPQTKPESTTNSSLKSRPGFTPDYLVSFDAACIVSSEPTLNGTGPGAAAGGAGSCAFGGTHHLTNVPALAEKTQTSIFSYLKRYQNDVPFPCMLMHWANTLAKQHLVSRYSQPDAFIAMAPGEQISESWTYLSRDGHFTLGNGLVILGGSKYKRVMGCYGVGVRAEGLLYAGVSAAGDAMQMAKNAMGTNQTSGTQVPTIAQTQSLNELSDTAIVDCLPSTSTVTFPLYYYYAPHRVGRDLLLLRGAMIDSDCAIHGPFLYKGIPFTKEDLIHADGTFAHLRLAKQLPAPNAKGNSHRVKEHEDYVEYCMDARLNDPVSSHYMPRAPYLNLPVPSNKAGVGGSGGCLGAFAGAAPLPTSMICAPPTLDCFGHHSATYPPGCIPALGLSPHHLSPTAALAERACSPKGGYVSPTKAGFFRRCQYCGLISAGTGALFASLQGGKTEIVPVPRHRRQPGACSKCDVYYCNRTCQIAHWQQGHKRLCAAWNAYRAVAAPAARAAAKPAQAADNGNSAGAPKLPAAPGKAATSAATATAQASQPAATAATSMVTATAVAPAAAATTLAEKKSASGSPADGGKPVLPVGASMSPKQQQQGARSGGNASVNAKGRKKARPGK